ncbi:hypothetical protein SAY86_028195 [Trapa natans]|uniref:Uncharacterized protein n=1 Tax=Trapa natans TaxID=22666 RepID=A0AAN7M1V2_TRANT|nr:hypothetical protein SAY86_028195 [Trapa natans]
MAATFQVLGAATGLSFSGSFDPQRLHLPSIRSVSERRTGFLVVRSDGHIVSSWNFPARRTQQFITSSIATKANEAASATTSKPGYGILYDMMFLVILCKSYFFEPSGLVGLVWDENIIALGMMLPFNCNISRGGMEFYIFSTFVTQAKPVPDLH